MDFYHSWIYTHVLNTAWFMWTVVFSVLGINLLAPVIVWYFLIGRKLLEQVRARKKEPQHSSR